ncbi:MAG: helical backbone metal receptor [Candidatus Eisenbacteria bacterium]
MTLARFRTAGPLALIFLIGAFALFRGGAGGPRPSDIDTAGPLRILSLSPNLTEILFALGLGDRVVGVTDYCRFPPEAREKPKVGALLNPSLERMFALEPNLIVLLPAHGGIGDRMAARGLRTLILPNDTVGDIFASIDSIGRATGSEEAARVLADSLRNALGEVTADPPDRVRRVMIVVSRTEGSVKDVFVAGPGTYLDELLRRAGGENVFGRSAARYPEPSVEEILHKNPEVILEIRPEGDGAAAETRLARGTWGTLPGLAAVERGNVFVLTGDHLVVPGPRMGETLRDIAAALREAR